MKGLKIGRHVPSKVSLGSDARGIGDRDLSEFLLQYENPDCGYYTVLRWNNTMRANDDAHAGLMDYCHPISRLYELKSR